MTDQPRDLAAEVERIAQLPRVIELGSGMQERLRASWSDVDTLLLHIAALSRELEEHREALRWLWNTALTTVEDGRYLVLCAKTDQKPLRVWVEPPAHLAPILAKALEGK